MDYDDTDPPNFRILVYWVIFAWAIAASFLHTSYALLKWAFGFGAC